MLFRSRQLVRFFGGIPPRCCFSCQQQSGSIFRCKICMAFQPLTQLSYFSPFYASPRYNLNIADLRSSFLEYQRIFHPDRFAQASEQERHDAAQCSTFLNKAWNTLKDPYKRALYFLCQKRCAVVQSQKRVEQVLADQGQEDFLFRVLELREEIETLEEEGRVEEIKKIAEAVQNERVEIEKKVADLLRILEDEKEEKIDGKIDNGTETKDKEDKSQLTAKRSSQNTENRQEITDQAILLLAKWKYLDGVLEAANCIITK